MSIVKMHYYLDIDIIDNTFININVFMLHTNKNIPIKQFYSATNNHNFVLKLSYKSYLNMYVFLVKFYVLIII